MLSEEQECVEVTEASSMINAEQGSGIVSTAGKRKHSEESETNDNTNLIPHKRACMGSAKDVEHDHTYSVSSPRRLKRKVDNLLDQADYLKRRLDTSQKKARRLKKKVNSLTSVVSELKKEKLVSSDFSGVPKELMKRLVTQKKKKNPGAYPKELRSFAMTLKFYSVKAYKYVRNSFDLGLPHPSVISSWYNAMDGEPGFTKEALTALKAKVLAAKRDGQKVVCALMLDEMSIRKHVQWDGNKYRGFVDLGTDIDDDSLPEATEALVFMAVSVNSNWKVQCEYFLVNGLTGEEKANLTKDCLTKLLEVGVKVVSFTCDGPTTHQAMLKLLGARLSADNRQAYFPHPCDNNENIYVFLDACHMIKLVRNTLSDWKVMKDSDGNPTVKFIRIFDRLFDVLNSRNPKANSFKAPIRKTNYQFVKKFLNDACEYIKGLKGPDGMQPILKSKRKTGFLGFLLCAEAVQGLAKDLVSGENPVLKYILTYKMSQDHLELFFGAVRASGGWNNNPTAMQFRSAYKQLLMRHNITGGRGNCVPQDDTEMLSNVEDESNSKSSTIEIKDVMIARRYDLALRPEPAATDHDYCDVPNVMELSEFKTSAISYIAGYVVRMVERTIHCLKCLAALKTTKE